MFKKRFSRLILILGLFVGSIILIIPPEKKINLGLDLKGGMHLIYKVDTSHLEPEKRKGASERAVEIIRSRIDELGVKEPVIQPQGEERILIQLPGVVDRERALSIIGRTALLEFKLVEDREEVIKENQEKLNPEYEWKEFKGRKLLLKKEPLLKGGDLADAQIGFGSYGESKVLVKFNSQGAKKFSKITGENVGKRLAIILDGKIKSAPVIREPISSGEAQITGDFTVDEAKDLALVLRSGALPCPLYIEEERTVGPLLGEDSIRRGISATLVGGLCVVLFMLIYYRIGGLVSIFALIFNLLLILASLSVLGATLTLPGIAGIILTIGMAVDASVLIYERIREELKLKKPLDMALRIGREKAFRTILDANLTTLLAAFCLFTFGTGPIKGFGLTLILGILSSMFTVLVVSRFILEELVARKKLRTFKMLSLIKQPRFNFIGKIKLCLFISTLLIMVGIFFFVKNRKIIYGIDFSGGEIQEYQFERGISLEEIRKALTEEGIGDVSLYKFSTSDMNVIAIKSSEDKFSEVKKVLDERFKGKYNILRIERVGPVVGKLLRRKAILAIIFAILGILIYVSIRFKHFDFALAAVVALFHDIFMSLSFLIFFSYKINLLVVTALLTIAGYSINDTIVIYDRIRELSLKLPKLSFKERINTAINQTLSRSIITSVTTILVVLCIFIFGGQVLKGFSFTLLVGFIAGTYSSIYIASPLVIFLRKK